MIFTCTGSPSTRPIVVNVCPAARPLNEAAACEIAASTGSVRDRGQEPEISLACRWNPSRLSNLSRSGGRSRTFYWPGIA
ncbi:hypothetical protein ACIBQ1_09030 [Nonomuraea sp. NPDC050153]|uniref:hypothetical protein n=1 Tax=Nonomuraea sp. NPDC050153 TaxID=3364359 RepID=UPI0037A87813